MTIQQSEEFREARRLSTAQKATISQMLKLQKAAEVMPPGEAKRYVYNCRNQWELRVQLARSEGEGPVGDEAVDKVHDFVGKFRQYLHEALGRNSYDGLGSDLIANVHFGMAYNNAFWDGEEFAAGDGDGSVFTSFASSLDVVAHELGHGVVQTTAGLQYYSQSGALNEHFADIFGAVVTQLDNDQDSHNADWLIGDEIMGPAVPPGEALRSMAAPGLAYNNPIMGQDPPARPHEQLLRRSRRQPGSAYQ
jgi:Zn-dependent metalloprotease